MVELDWFPVIICNVVRFQPRGEKRQVWKFLSVATLNLDDTSFFEIINKFYQGILSHRNCNR